MLRNIPSVRYVSYSRARRKVVIESTYPEYCLAGHALTASYAVQARGIDPHTARSWAKIARHYLEAWYKVRVLES